jgi:WD40 repeat protein
MANENKLHSTATLDPRHRLTQVRQLGVGACIGVVILIIVIQGLASSLATSAAATRNDRTINPLSLTLAALETQVSNANATLTPAAIALATSQSYSQSLSYAAKAEQALRNPRGGNTIAILLAIRGLKAGYSAESESVLVKSLSTYYRRTLLVGYSEHVSNLAYSPDGRTVLSVSDDKTARIWDADTGGLIKILPHPAPVVSGSYSPNGRTILTGFCRKIENRKCVQWDAQIWDAATGTLLGTLFSHAGLIFNMKYSPDGRTIITTSDDQTVRVWDAITGSLRLTLSNYNFRVRFATYSPDGGVILTLSGNVLQTWNALTGDLLWTFSDDKVWRFKTLAFNTDGQTILIASSDPTILKLHMSTGMLISSVNINILWPLRIAVYSPDGGTYLTIDDNYLNIWDSATGVLLQTISDNNMYTRAIAFSPDGRHIVTSDYNTAIKIWHIDRNSVPGKLFRHEQGVEYSIYSPNGRMILTVLGSVARVWDASSAKILRTFRHDGSITDATFSPDGRTILTVAANKIHVLDIALGKTLYISSQVGSFRSADYSPDGRTIVAASSSTLWLLDAATGISLNSRDDMRLASGRVRYSPDGTKLLISNGRIEIWNANTLDYILSIKTMFEDFIHAAYSPDGRTIISSKYSGSVEVWDANTGRLLRNLPTIHMLPPNTVNYSPDGRTIVTTSNDRTARVWNAVTGELLHTLTGHTSWVNSATYSPDGRHILTASTDRTVRIWDADYRGFVAYACAEIWRDFTLYERTEYGIPNDPTCPKFAITPSPFPTITPVRETWTPFPLRDTPDPVFIPSYTPGPSPTAIPSLTPTVTFTPRPTKSPTATATILISPFPTRTIPVWTPIASPTPSNTPTGTP